MIDKLIAHFTKHFELTQYLIDDDTGWYLQSTCSLNGKVIYVNRLDMTSLYESMKKRMEEQK